jgi:very-short-patch-repair endonuclease
MKELIRIKLRELVSESKVPHNKRTAEDFIELAKKIHGDKYDYSDVEYKNARTKIKINCPKHGQFEQVPDSHLKGYGCDKCAREIQATRRRHTKDDFIRKSLEIHGNKYDYSNVDYVNFTTPVEIKCTIHGSFYQTPREHYDGSGCPKCFGKNKNTDEIIDIIKKIHGDKYELSKVNFKNNKTPITLICPIHGDFEILPERVIHQKSGCPKCAGKQLTNDEWIQRAKDVHGEKYDYKNFNYTKSINKTIIGCLKHGDFLMSPNDHINNAQGCPKCRESKGEIFVTEILDKMGKKYIKQKKFDDCYSNRGKYCKKLPFDFYLPKENICIEYDGRQHSEPVYGDKQLSIQKIIDNIKNVYCNKVGIKLIRISHKLKPNEIITLLKNEL